MSRLPNPVVQVKPQANVYTVLMLVAIVVLGAALGMLLQQLLSSTGYGLSAGDLFGPLAK